MGEPLRTKVLSSRGLTGLDGRPGASLPDYDFEEATKELTEKYGAKFVDEKDVLSHALYPNVFLEWKEFEAVYGEVSKLPTDLFLNPLKEGDEVDIELKAGERVLSNWSLSAWPGRMD